MALQTLLSEDQQQSGTEQKSVSKGVQGEPTRDAEKKDAQTPPVDAQPGAKKTESFVFGIPQDGLQQKEREVPLDEPPPLPQNSELTYIGKPTPRYDGPAKAMGRGKYTADVNCRACFTRAWWMQRSLTGTSCRSTPAR